MVRPQYLHPKQPLPDLPFELEGHVSTNWTLFFLTLNRHQVTANAWATRVSLLNRVGSRYNRPTLEGIWLVLMFM